MSLSQSVIVVGGGVAGLVAARQHALAGAKVRLFEANPMLGGVVKALHLSTPQGQLNVDAGAEAFATRTNTVAELIAELGLEDDVESPNPAGSWLYLPEVGAVAAPRLGLLGIPGDLDAPEVAQALGAVAYQRALEDRTAPVDEILDLKNSGAPVTLGELVALRMGPEVVQRLVAPVVAGVHSADPYQVQAEAMIPNILQLVINAGSLSAAVASLRAQAPAGAMVASLRGGMNRLVAALEADLINRGVDIHTSTPVQALDLNTHSVTAGDATYSADRLVVATDQTQTQQLLATAGMPEISTPPSSGVGLVTLVIDHPELDNNPRGTGLLVAAEATDVAAKAMTHASAKWDWAKQAAQTLAPHRHIVRLSYGRITDAPDAGLPGYYSTDEKLIDLAVKDVSTLTGIPGLADHIVTSAVVRWKAGLPVLSVEHQQQVHKLQDFAAATGWITLTGAWVSGTGLAAVIRHARTLDSP